MFSMETRCNSEVKGFGNQFSSINLATNISWCFLSLHFAYSTTEDEELVGEHIDIAASSLSSILAGQ